MAVVTRVTGAHMDTRSIQLAAQISSFPNDKGGTLYAGEALPGACPCYIETTAGANQGKVFRCNGAAADQKAVLAGWTPKAYNVGDPVTLFGPGAVLEYAAGTLTPGQKLYLAATPGDLDNAATTGDAVGVAQAINAYHIRATRWI